MIRYAVVDIGSNTLKMNIYDTNPRAESTGGVVCTPVLNETKTVGLMNYNQNSVMSEPGIIRLIETLSEYKKLAEKINVDHIYYIATASLRNAENHGEIIALVKERIDIDIELISGEEEAVLSFKGLKYGAETRGEQLHSGIMIDMGGGSTELTGFIDGLAVRALSIPFGCLSLFKQFVSGVLPCKDEIEKIKKFVDSKAEEVNWLANYGGAVYLVGGTGKAISKLHAELAARSVQDVDVFYELKYSEMKEIAKTLKSQDKKMIEILVKSVPDRLHTIIPGLTAYNRLLKHMNAENVVIAGVGLREGYLTSKLG